MVIILIITKTASLATKSRHPGSAIHSTSIATAAACGVGIEHHSGYSTASPVLTPDPWLSQSVVIYYYYYYYYYYYDYYYYYYVLLCIIMYYVLLSQLLSFSSIYHYLFLFLSFIR